jgi:hypothetical protein
LVWESPRSLWSRLKLGREEFLQRVISTLIADGDPPPWNTPCSPGPQGRRFLQLLDDLAHADHPQPEDRQGLDAFVDEYRLPKLQEHAENGWPDWAVLWPERLWLIELKTETASHRDDQLAYYLTLAAAAHPDRRIDLTYLTGPLSKPAPPLADGQRYRHLTWELVLPLIERTWGDDPRPEVGTYVATVRTIIENLTVLRPSEQRAALLGQRLDVPLRQAAPRHAPHHPDAGPTAIAQIAEPGYAIPTHHLLGLARQAAVDGRQRAVGAASPSQLEDLYEVARDLIATLEPGDPARFVLPWLWRAGRTDGTALTSEGHEFGYELRFSRYKTPQVKA